MARLHKAVASLLFTLLLAIALPRLNLTSVPFLSRVLTRTMSSNSTVPVLPRTQSEWRAALAALPSTPERIPVFYFAHGSPMLAMDDGPGQFGSRPGIESAAKALGPRGPLGTFLRDFGPALLEKYKPKGIAVFSAHWDTDGERLGTLWLAFQNHVGWADFRMFGSDGLWERESAAV